MSITAKTLIQSQYAPNSTSTLYTAPPPATTIVDKLTATNNDSGSQTITIYLVPNGSSADGSNEVINAKSLAAGATYDFTELKNHILSQGDSIQAVASVASKICVRASGREIV